MERLREAVITGHFAPGSRLVERTLCDMLGVSRTLVRESLRQLESEGWVKLLPNRGPVVATMTDEDIRELYEVRGALEGLAAQLCAERATDAHLHRMGEAVAAMEAAHLQQDTEEQRRQAERLYDLLRKGAGNKFLAAQLAAMGARLTWLRALAFSLPERASASVHEERALLAALTERDGAAARRLCEMHLGDSVEILIQALKGRVAAGP